MKLSRLGLCRWSALRLIHYDILAYPFRVIGRLERCGKTLIFFLQRFGDPQDYQYTLCTHCKSPKYGRVALTSYAAQKVHDRVSVEQDAVDVPSNGGLRVSAPHKTVPIDLRLNWDAYGTTTFEGIQAILMEHQPRTFNLIHRFSIPTRHEPTKEYRYRHQRLETTQRATD